MTATLFRATLVLVLAASTAAFAQEGKKRLVFPDPSATPLPAPTAADQSDGDPRVALERFFKSLREGRIDEAYEELAADSVFAAAPENFEELKQRTRAAIDNFGPVLGHEVVAGARIGDRLFRQTCISLNEDLPLRWRFYFYRPEDKWKIIDMRVDDGIVELFDETERLRGGR